MRVFPSLCLAAACILLGASGAAAAPPSAQTVKAAQKSAGIAALQPFVGKWVEEGGLRSRYEIKIADGQLQVVQILPGSDVSLPCRDVAVDGSTLTFYRKQAVRQTIQLADGQAPAQLPPGILPQGAQPAQSIGLHLALESNNAVLRGNYVSDTLLNGLATQLKRVDAWPPVPADAGPLVIQFPPGAQPAIQKPR